MAEEKSPGQELREFVEKSHREFDVLKMKPYEYQFLKGYLTAEQREKYESHQRVMRMAESVTRR
jgi:hypothetical protein